jgi:hypothetical protein
MWATKKNSSNDFLLIKQALLSVLGKYNISNIKPRGQASNIRGEFNGLQKRTLDDNSYTFLCILLHSIHHLQLLVIFVASCRSCIHDFLFL